MYGDAFPFLVVFLTSCQANLRSNFRNNVGQIDPTCRLACRANLHLLPKSSDSALNILLCKLFNSWLENCYYAEHVGRCKLQMRLPFFSQTPCCSDPLVTRGL